MVAEDFDDTNILFSLTKEDNLGYKRYFDFVKSILKQRYCTVWLNEEAGNWHVTVLSPCVIFPWAEPEFHIPCPELPTFPCAR